jgi:AraC-like DNA-binding protein/ligand-binding sensor protein
MSKKSPADPFLARLSKSQIYRDYDRAFTSGTGLQLALQAPDMLHLVRYARRQQNPFCAFMAQTNQSCAQCYALQCKLEQEAQLQPKTLKCFAGLCETAVPVRVGDKLIAFLRTGQILVERPSKLQFNKIAASLIKWGADVDLKRVEEAYYNTRVLSPKQYESLIRLLTIFDQHLASWGNALALESESKEPIAVSRARDYIREHFADELSLERVAKVVNMSANYFSEKFKQAAGIRFVEFVARSRVEKARNLLQNPKFRISEVAFDVGFRSLSQFNRVFKKFTGQSPREYRASLALT